jgi:sulfopyruvate decarboxylase TPP-binding subunit
LAIAMRLAPERELRKTGASADCGGGQSVRRARMIETFVNACKDAGVDLIVSVPDGYIVPLIERIDADRSIRHIAASREEECLGVAAGAAMTGKRVVALMQNVGFLNALGCFATLCINYRTPFLIVVSHRGNIYDNNAYDVLKYKYFELAMRNTGIFTVRLSDNVKQNNLIAKLLGRSALAQEPSILLLDQPLDV